VPSASGATTPRYVQENPQALSHQSLAVLARALPPFKSSTAKSPTPAAFQPFAIFSKQHETQCHTISHRAGEIPTAACQQSLKVLVLTDKFCLIISTF
jgi:hypothetical protein